MFGGLCHHVWIHKSWQIIVSIYGYAPAVRRARSCQFRQFSGEMVFAIWGCLCIKIVCCVQCLCIKGQYHNAAFYISGGQDQVWLSGNDIDRLVKISCGQFLYASTIVWFVDDEDFHPEKSLAVVLGLRTGDSSPFPDLDRLYTQVLRRQCDQVFLSRFLTVLAAFSQDIHFANVSGIHHNVPIINGILNLEEGAISRKLRGMHSLLRVSRESIAVYHVSFLEFLQDRSRSHQYHVSHPKAMARLLLLLTTAAIRYAFQSLGRSPYASFVIALSI